MTPSNRKPLAGANRLGARKVSSTSNNTFILYKKQAAGAYLPEVQS